MYKLERKIKARADRLPRPAPAPLGKIRQRRPPLGKGGGAGMLSSLVGVSVAERIQQLQAKTASGFATVARPNNAAANAANPATAASGAAAAADALGARDSGYRRLVDSEQKYLGELSAVSRLFLRPLRDDAKLPKPVLFARPEYQRIVVFLNNIETLATLNAKFFDDLKAKQAKGLGQVWTQYAPLFKMYGQYAANCGPALGVIDAQRLQNLKFREFVVDVERQAGSSLETLLHLPMERIDSYLAFLNDLIDASDAESDLELLKAALVELEAADLHVHEQLDGSKKLNRLRAMQQQWVGAPQQFARARNFFMEGNLDKVSRKQTRACRFLLLPDVLLYGNLLPADKIKFKRALPLDTMVIVDAKPKTITRAPLPLRAARAIGGGSGTNFDLAKDDDGNDEDVERRAFFIMTKVKSFKVFAGTEQVAEEWSNALKTRIEAVRAMEGLAAPTFDDLKPVWVPDYQSKGCMKCGKLFNLIRRRHHCRRCGMLVCAPCSRKRILGAVQTSPQDPANVKETKVRVCDDCASSRPSVRFSAAYAVQTSPDATAVAAASAAAAIPESSSSSRHPASSSSSSSGPTAARPTLITMFAGGSNNGLLNVMLDQDPGEDAQAIEVVPLRCRAVYNFTAPEDEPSQITVVDGDMLSIEEVEGGWATGTNQGTGQYGFLPAWAVVIDATGEELPELYDGMAAANTSSTTMITPRGAEVFSSPDRLRVSVSSPLSPKGEEPALSPRGGGSGGGSDRHLHVSNRASFQLPFFDASDTRAKVFYEICTSERSYLESLSVLLKSYIRPLTDDYRSGRPTLGGNVLAMVDDSGANTLEVFFSHLEHIFTVNTQLFSALKNRMQTWDSQSSLVGEVFESFAPLFRFYGEYSALYEFATKTLADRERVDAKLRRFMAEKNAETNMTAFFFLIMPIQRVPRYLLLLKELIKATPAHWPDHEPLQRAVRIVQEQAVHINEHIREREKLLALRELDAEFPSLGIADKPDRVLVHRGNLVKKSRKKDQQYHFVLLSDMLIYQKGKIANDSKPSRKYDINDKTNFRPTVEGNDLAFDVIFEAKSFRVVAGDANDKATWVAKLSNTIQAQKRSPGGAGGGGGGGAGGIGGLGLGSGRVANVLAMGHVRRYSSGDVAPVWNQDTDKCEECRKDFNVLTRRRHHCRDCGRCLCDDCTQHRLVLEHIDPDREQRVCARCFGERATKSVDNETVLARVRNLGGVGVLPVHQPSSSSSSSSAAYAPSSRAGRRRSSSTEMPTGVSAPPSLRLPSPLFSTRKVPGAQSGFGAATGSGSIGSASSPSAAPSPPRTSAGEDGRRPSKLSGLLSSMGSRKRAQADELPPADVARPSGGVHGAEEGARDEHRVSPPRLMSVADLSGAVARLRQGQGDSKHNTASSVDFGDLASLQAPRRQSGEALTRSSGESGSGRDLSGPSSSGGGGVDMNEIIAKAARMRDTREGKSSPSSSPLGKPSSPLAEAATRTKVAGPILVPPEPVEVEEEELLVAEELEVSAEVELAPDDAASTGDEATVIDQTEEAVFEEQRVTPVSFAEEDHAEGELALEQHEPSGSVSPSSEDVDTRTPPRRPAGPPADPSPPSIPPPPPTPPESYAYKPKQATPEEKEEEEEENPEPEQEEALVEEEEFLPEDAASEFDIL